MLSNGKEKEVHNGHGEAIDILFAMARCSIAATPWKGGSGSPLQAFFQFVS
jgi:hypothetical protein